MERTGSEAMERSGSALITLCKAASCGAAQIAVAWYLMTAPYVGPLSARKIDPSAPLSQWSILAPYDSIAECENMRQALIQPRAPQATKATLRCIPNNDSRIRLGARLPKGNRSDVR